LSPHPGLIAFEVRVSRASGKTQDKRLRSLYITPQDFADMNVGNLPLRNTKGFDERRLA